MAILQKVDATQMQSLTAYAADLELEVDRLRRRDRFWQQESRERIKRIAQLCQKQNDLLPTGGDPLEAITEACRDFRELLADLNEPGGYHPAFDQVVAIAIRPLVEQVFREQQRISGAETAVLRLDLESEHLIWFPVRLRHILDNLISNSLRYRDPAKGEVRVGLALHVLPNGYELQLSDNGLGMPPGQSAEVLELFYRAAPMRASGLGVGLAVVKLLVEHCCGEVTVLSGDGQGTTIAVRLPRFDVDDHVE